MSSDEGSASDRYVQPAVLTKDEKKIIKKFCTRLLSRTDEWEPQEKASLAILLQQELQLSQRQFLKLVSKSEICTPAVLACLGDHGIQFPPQNIIRVLCSRGEMSIAKVEEAFEQGLLSITVDEHLREVVYKYVL